MKYSQKIKGFIQKTRKIFFRRRFWIIAIAVTFIFSWSGGFLTSWWWSHGRLGLFPTIDNKTRLLLIAPHPDDEVLIAGGIIQRVISQRGEVKIIYLTMGDASIGSVVRKEKNTGFQPSDFLDLAEKRKNESLRAVQYLGLYGNDAVFLGFPDKGLQEVLLRDVNDSRGSVISKTTKMDHVPYSWAYKPGQAYNDNELMSDLQELIRQFKPTTIITTHFKDSHPDHRASYDVLDKIREQGNNNWDLYLSLVHFRDYPGKGSYLIPPKKLFNDKWVSFELNSREKEVKDQAILQFSSQIFMLDKNWYLKFIASNEIFELD